MTHFKTTLGILAAFALVGLASLAFADGPGYGRYGHMMGGSDGYYGHMMGGGGWGRHMMGYGRDDDDNFSREDAATLERAGSDFYESTRSLRADIRDQQRALDSALREENPDPAQLAKLQKALSALQGDLDQKALAYRLEVAKIQPRAGRDGGGYGPGDCGNR